MFKFENLKVWQKSLDITVKIHTLTQKFPKEELFILTSQIKRASDSIALNIAEGSTGQSDAEQNKFLGYAIRSGIEVVACLHIAQKRNLISNLDFQNLYQELEELIKMLQAFRKILK